MTGYISHGRVDQFLSGPKLQALTNQYKLMPQTGPKC